MPTIKIKQWDKPVEMHKGSILDAALKLGVPYPHSCRSGECGICKTRLLCGEVDQDPCLAEALSAAERERGFILACRSRPRTDLEVAWADEPETTPDFAVRQLKAKVVGLELATHNVSRLRLKVRGKPLEFAAGQYARLRIGKLPARSFSMANRPDDDTLEFHIRHVPDGLVSGYVASQLKLGDTVRLESPFGTSYLRKQHPGAIVAAAGGTGLAPVLSIVRTALAQMSARPIHIYFGAQDDIDIYAESELRQLASQHPQVNSHIVLSAPSGPTERRTGFIHHALEQDLTDLTGAKIYAAGPPPMVRAVTGVATTRGVCPADIHSDPFTLSASEEESESPRFLHSITNLFTTSASGKRIEAHSR